MADKILIFIDWFRPGYRAGGPVTSVANLVDRLAGEPPAEHPGEPPAERVGEPEFFILTRNTDYGEAIPYQGIEPGVWTQAAPHVQVCYLSGDQLNPGTLLKKAREADCSTWYVNGIYSWYFSILPLLLARRIPPGKTVISTRGMLLPHARAVKPAKKTLFLTLARILRLYRNAIFHATTPEEAEAIRAAFGNGTPVSVAPNLPVRNVPSRVPVRQKEPGNMDLLFLGRISPEKNTLKALELVSGIENGTVTLHLAGETGDREYRALCDRMIAALPGRIRVRDHGAVPPDRLPGILLEAHFLFLPTTGENHGHAVIECLSYGLPAVISDRTPWTDLQEAGAGWVVSLDNEPLFLEVLEACLEMDGDAYGVISRHARDYARKVIEDPTGPEAYLKLFAHETGNH